MSSSIHAERIRRTGIDENDQGSIPGVPLNDSTIVLSVVLIMIGVALGCLLSKLFKRWKRKSVVVDNTTSQQKNNSIWDNSVYESIKSNESTPLTESNRK